jgi:hypothetical protein
MNNVWYIFFIAVFTIIHTTKSTTDKNTTRLCRDKCSITALAFDQTSSFSSISDACGTVSFFYACRVTININNSLRKVDVGFSGHDENSVEMSTVNFEYAVETALNHAFYRDDSTYSIIFTCLTFNQCADEYTRVILPHISEDLTILSQLPPIFLISSTNERNFTCVDKEDVDVPCNNSGFCESITQDITPWWIYRNCRYPSASSVFTATELTGVIAIFDEFEPQNQSTDHVNDKRLTLLCNVDLCNSREMVARATLILDEYNQAAFELAKNLTTFGSSTSPFSTLSYTATSTDDIVSFSSETTTDIFVSTSTRMPDIQISTGEISLWHMPQSFPDFLFFFQVWKLGRLCS